MSEGKGCLKKTMFGCLGLFALSILFTVLGSIWAMNMVQKNQETGPVLQPLADLELLTKQEAFPAWALGYPGRVILNLQRGGFYLHPAAAGEPARAEASFDAEVFQLTENFVMLPDSTWVYEVAFSQISSGWKSMFGGGSESRVDIYLPFDTPFELAAQIKQGGIEAELGGLWLTDADVRYNMGGFELSLKEPLREPMNTLAIRGTMGGFDGTSLGNASPRVLLVRCGMGGANLDLRGAWSRDCIVDLGMIMGGMAVRVPVDVAVSGADDLTDGQLRHANPEIPIPVLSFTSTVKMGEVEILQK